MSFYYVKDIKEKDDGIYGKVADSSLEPRKYSGNIKIAENIADLTYNILDGNFKITNQTSKYNALVLEKYSTLKNYYFDCIALGINKCYEKYKNVIDKVLANESYKIKEIPNCELNRINVKYYSNDNFEKTNSLWNDLRDRIKILKASNKFSNEEIQNIYKEFKDRDGLKYFAEMSYKNYNIDIYPIIDGTAPTLNIKITDEREVPINTFLNPNTFYTPKAFFDENDLKLRILKDIRIIDQIKEIEPKLQKLMNETSNGNIIASPEELGIDNDIKDNIVSYLNDNDNRIADLEIDKNENLNFDFYLDFCPNAIENEEDEEV